MVFEPYAMLIEIRNDSENIGFAHKTLRPFRISELYKLIHPFKVYARMSPMRSYGGNRTFAL